MTLLEEMEVSSGGLQPGTEAKLVEGKTLAQHVIEFLLEGGLTVEILIKGKIYRGYVSNLDFAPARGQDHVFVKAYLAKAYLANEEGDEVFARFSIYTDGRCLFLGFEE